MIRDKFNVAQYETPKHEMKAYVLRIVIFKGARYKQTSNKVFLAIQAID